MSELMELADRLWRGEASAEEHHVEVLNSDLVELAPGTAFIPAFANVSAFAVDEALVLVDTGNAVLANVNFERVRRWSELPLHTAIYTHGHKDHVAGVGPYDLRLAAHLAEVAAQVSPDDPDVHEVRAAIFAQRAEAERSLMARGIVSDAARESQARTTAS